MSIISHSKSQSKSPQKTSLCLALGLIALSLYKAPKARAINAEGSQIMMSAPSRLAVETGEQIFAESGNVVDVAVAMALSLTVTSPYFASLGGGGFALIKINSKVEVVDFRETAPAKSDQNFFLNKPADSSTNGGNSVAVPGLAMGLWEMHQKYGKLKWEKLFKQPLLLAEDGFRVTGEWVNTTNTERARFNQVGSRHLQIDGHNPRPGDLLKQPSLAKALSLLRRRGTKGFYEGPVAGDLVATVQKAGGVLTLEDLKAYRAHWREPLSLSWNGYKIYLMPPPSSGGILLKTILQLTDSLKLSTRPPMAGEELHLWAEILARAFRTRSLLGDPSHVENPMTQLSSPSYLEMLTQSIDLKKTKVLEPLDLAQISKGQADETPSSGADTGKARDAAQKANRDNKRKDPLFNKEKPETTHFTVMDSDGNTVSLTVTLNGNYGSGLISETFGIALNNEMDDFTTIPGKPNMFGLIQGTNNLVQPGKRPLSSMSPTIVEKNGRTVLALGAPGGSRIISAVAQVLYRHLVNKFSLDMAIQTPRVHHQFSPHKLYLDKNRWPPETLDLLRKKGHLLEESNVARVFAVGLTPDGILEAAFDSRGEGFAGGY